MCVYVYLFIYLFIYIEIIMLTKIVIIRIFLIEFLCNKKFMKKVKNTVII